MIQKKLIGIIGNGRLSDNSNEAELAFNVGKRLIDTGYYRIITGGLGGVMEYASKGARNSKKYQSGDIIGILPGHKPDFANRFVDIIIPTGFDIARNVIIAHSDAVIAIGGGAGTLSEMASSWTLNRLVIGMKISGWSLKLADKRIDDRVRYPDIPEDRVFGATDADEVIKILDKYLSIYICSYCGIGDKTLDQVW